MFCKDRKQPSEVLWGRFDSVIWHYQVLNVLTSTDWILNESLMSFHQKGRSNFFFQQTVLYLLLCYVLLVHQLHFQFKF